jgi:hypothetical protein
MTLLGPTADGARYELTSPTSLPLAGAFLWNQKMMVQVKQHHHHSSPHKPSHENCQLILSLR